MHKSIEQTCYLKFLINKQKIVVPESYDFLLLEKSISLQINVLIFLVLQVHLGKVKYLLIFQLFPASFHIHNQFLFL